MTVQTMIDTIIKLSDRTELEDENVTVLFWLNQFKLSFQRDNKYAFMNNTIPVGLVQNTRDYNIPDDYLAPVSLRRRQRNIFKKDNKLGLVTQRQHFNKYIDKVEFEYDYPELDGDGNEVTGIPNAYFMGSNLRVGPTPQADETVWFDYWRSLPEYDLVVVTEDKLSKIGYDLLIFGTLKRIFQAWIISPSKAADWGNELNRELRTLKSNETFAEASFQQDQLYIEEFG